MAGVPQRLEGRTFTRIANWSCDVLYDCAALPGSKAQNRLHTQKALMALVIR